MSKILSKIGKKKKIAGKKNRWEKKQNRLRPSVYVCACMRCSVVFPGSLVSTREAAHQAVASKSAVPCINW